MSDYKPLACLPVLPLRGIVVFPGCVTHFDVGRSRSARAVEEAMRADQMIFLVAQRDVQCDEPKKTDLVLATMAFATGLAQVIGGYVVSPIVTSVGYLANAQFVMAPLALLAAVLVVVFVKSDRSVAKVRKQESEEDR